MEKNQKYVVKQHVVNMFVTKHRKPIVIITSVLLLQILFGFDAKFTIINLIWLLK